MPRRKRQEDFPPAPSFYDDDDDDKDLSLTTGHTSGHTTTFTSGHSTTTATPNFASRSSTSVSRTGHTTNVGTPKMDTPLFLPRSSNTYRSSLAPSVGRISSSQQQQQPQPFFGSDEHQEGQQHPPLRLVPETRALRATASAVASKAQVVTARAPAALPAPTSVADSFGRPTFFTADVVINGMKFQFRQPQNTESENSDIAAAAAAAAATKKEKKSKKQKKKNKKSDTDSDVDITVPPPTTPPIQITPDEVFGPYTMLFDIAAGVVLAPDAMTGAVVLEAGKEYSTLRCDVAQNRFVHTEEMPLAAKVRVRSCTNNFSEAEKLADQLAGKREIEPDERQRLEKVLIGQMLIAERDAS